MIMIMDLYSGISVKKIIKKNYLISPILILHIELLKVLELMVIF
jgi:hypothetical protein